MKTSLIIVKMDEIISTAVTVAIILKLIINGSIIITVAATNTRFTIEIIAVAVNSVTKQIVMIKTWRNTGQDNPLDCTCARSRVLLIYNSSNSSNISSSILNDLYNNSSNMSSNSNDKSNSSRKINNSSKIRNGITIYKIWNIFIHGLKGMITMHMLYN